MKLGVFDSGLGGLVITKAIREHIPDIDIVYFGDTLHVPYGNRSKETIYSYSKRAIEFLFEQDCALIITACNTVSASALRRLQQEYLPNSAYKERRILGVVVPTLETALDAGHTNIGLIATHFTVQSGVYKEELQKINPNISLQQVATPLLVPLIENHGKKWIPNILEDYLAPLIEQDIQCLILGCTHYPFCKNEIRTILGEGIQILSQDQIIPEKLEHYLSKHTDIKHSINYNFCSEFYVSDLTQAYKNTAKEIYAQELELKALTYDHVQHKYTLSEDNK